MAKPKVKWNLKAFQEIRRLPKVDEMLNDVVEGILAGLPEGYEGNVTPGRTRSRGSVVTGDFDAILHNEKNQALLSELAKARLN